MAPSTVNANNSFCQGASTVDHAAKRDRTIKIVGANNFSLWQLLHRCKVMPTLHDSLLIPSSLSRIKRLCAPQELLFSGPIQRSDW